MRMMPVMTSPPPTWPPAAPPSFSLCLDCLRRRLRRRLLTSSSHPALRLKGDYLAIITLGFAEIIPRGRCSNIDNVLGFDLTGGAKGLTGIPKIRASPSTFVVALAIVIFLIHTFMKSRHGRAVLAIRDNEIAAEASGVNTTYYKTLAFVVSAFFAGVGGGLYAGCIGVMAPAKFGFMKSVEILVMVVLGGMGSMLQLSGLRHGPDHLPEALRAFSDYRMLAYSIVLILVMMPPSAGSLGSYDFSLSRVVERVAEQGPSLEEGCQACIRARREH